MTPTPKEERCPSCHSTDRNVRHKRVVGRRAVVCSDPFHTQPRDTGSEATPPDDIEAAFETLRAALIEWSSLATRGHLQTYAEAKQHKEADAALDLIHTALQEARADLDMARTHIRSVEDALELEQNRTVELIAEWVEARQEAFLQRQRALGDEALLVEATTRAERAEGLHAPALKENADLRTRAEKLAEAAIREHIKWHGSTGHEGLSAALSPTVETEGEPEPS